MKRFHIALGVSDIETSVRDYTSRLSAPPTVLIPGEYALWRTETVNLSIRKTDSEKPAQLRHLGWEDAASPAFSSERDVNGILWERFSAEQQQAEIRQTWPAAPPVPPQS